MHAYAARVTARWWAGAIALFFLLASGAVIGVVGQAERTPGAADALPIGSDSAKALVLAGQLPEADAKSAIVLFTKASGKLAPTDLQAITAKAGQLPGATAAPPVPSEDGTAAFSVVEVDPAGGSDIGALVAELRAAAKTGLPEGVTAQVTGPAAIQADLGAVFDGADVSLLATTAAVVAILLLLTYRSPLLWLVPLTVVGVADQLAAVLATQTLAALDVVWDESTVGILSVLVFGAGTDYALLLISRYRDELHNYTDRREAMAHALRRTFEAVFSSAVTVVLGLLTLLLSVFPATRGLGLACAIGVVVAAAFALLVLPATLVVFGRWIFWPRIPRSVPATGRSLWRRVGDAVASRPAAFVGTSLAVLGVLALGVARVDTGLSQSDQFLKTPEAISAGERLSTSFPAGSADPVRIITTADPAAVAGLVGGVEGVSSVRVGPSSQGVVEVDAVLDASAESPAARAAVTAIREALSDTPATHVAGTTAEAMDVSDSSTRDRMLVLPVILALVLLALILLLRSIVAPLILVGTVVLTYLSSLGASWLLFTQVLGFERLDDSAPLLAFVFLVALGVDYNIFLVTRAREEAREHGIREGMIRGLAATGGVITSAGILLAAVFAVLGVLPLVVLAQIGVIICVGVLLDTLVVRTVLVPAIALLLGERFWWPNRTMADRTQRAADVPNPTGESRELVSDRA